MTQIQKYLTPQFWLIIFPFVMFSCDSNKLTREKSAKMINEFYQYPNLLIFEIDIKRDAFFDAIKSYKPLIENGLLYISGKYNLKYAITPSGSNYIVENPNIIALGKREFYEISGIKYLNENQSVAEVEYNCIITDFTPFGQILLNIKEGSFMKHKAKFELYDDGWRITEPRIKNYNPSSLLKTAENLKQNGIMEGCEKSEFSVKIIGDNVRLRSAPNIEEGNIILLLHKGVETVHLESKDINSEQWFKVCYFGKIGWVSSQFSIFLD
jgi:hypothetical protein